MSIEAIDQESGATSRFSGRSLAVLFDNSAIIGVFDDDVWNLTGHPDVAGGGGKRTWHFSEAPRRLRDVLKELVLIATRPTVHAADFAPDLMGVPAKDIKTVMRWLPGLTIDLAYLIEKADVLSAVRQEDFKSLKQVFKLEHRRIAALQAFARYSAAMSPSLDRLRAYPWPGRSALSVGGGLKKNDGRNTTPLFPLEDLAQWVESAMFLVQHGREIVDVATQELVTDPAAIRSKGRLRNERTRVPPPVQIARAQDLDGSVVEFLRSDCTRLEAGRILRQVAAACAFVTVAFTGMRASELEAVPRENPLEAIEVSGTKRWLLHSYLSKGLQAPIREKWLVPPIVADAVEVLLHLLERRGFSPGPTYAPTGKVPLFDRRALSTFREEEGGAAVMRLERVVEALGKAMNSMREKNLISDRPSSKPNGRQLRRNFTIVVAARPHGAQAAMEQFKWQHADTAAGYFRVAPEGVALGQRAVYEEVAQLQTELVVNALADEFAVWQSQVDAGFEPSLPTGPDGRRKRDMFASVSSAMTSEPSVEEDPRRLKRLLRDHAENIHLTEFGWCDWDEVHALCGGIGGPQPFRCQPYNCLNHSTPSIAVAAHMAKGDRLLDLAKDRTFPALARERASAEVKVIEDQFGVNLEARREY